MSDEIEAPELSPGVFRLVLAGAFGVGVLLSGLLTL